jgi:hypothetical protein
MAMFNIWRNALRYCALGGPIIGKKKMKPRLWWIVVGALLAQVAHADEMPREAWGDRMAKVLPLAFCEDGSYFRQCLNLDSENCGKASLLATRVCLTDLEAQIPKTFTSKEQLAKAGKMVGQCAGTSLELKFSRQKSKDSKCADLSKWK